MPSVSFKIDKLRSNYFYHYTKYIDGNVAVDAKGKEDKGWGLYSKLKTDEERAAWQAAVEEFNDNNEVETISARIKRKLEEGKKWFEIDKGKFPAKVSYIMPSLEAAINALNPTDKCNDNFINDIMQITGGALPTKENIAKYYLEAISVNLEIDMHTLLNNLYDLGVSAFINPVFDAAIKIVDNYIGTIDTVYNEYSVLAARPLARYRTWNFDVTASDEIKERAKKEFFDTASTFSGAEQKIIAYIIGADTFTLFADFWKNAKSLGKDSWYAILSQLRTLKAVFTGLNLPSKDIFAKLLDTLLFALGGLIGGLATAKCAEEKEIEESIATICEAEDVPDEAALIKKIDNDIKETQEKYSEHTIIYNQAVHNENGYSLYKITQPTSDTSSNSSTGAYEPIDDYAYICKVSMCETIDPTDTSEWYTSFEDIATKLIIEFDLRYNIELKVSVNDHIKLNSIIAYLNEVPVKSRLEFIVIEVGPNYIIGEYTSEFNELLFSQKLYSEEDLQEINVQVQDLLNEKIKEFSTNQYDEIIDKFKKFTYCKDFIRDYISFYRFAALAQYTREHTEGDAVAISSAKFIELYESIAQEFLDKYYDDVKKICKKKNLKKYLNKGQIPTLKQILDDRTDQCIDSILELYQQNPGNIKYCSLGRISDFMLCDHYLEYINSDKFQYDEDNPYIVRLADAINTFIGIRTRLELNKDNIEGLIISFNELCDATIKPYWTFKDIDYYTKLTELFQYDTYTNTDVIAEGTVTDSISLYKRVLNYIKALTKFSRTDEYNIETDDNTDYYKLLEEQDKQEDRKLNKKEIEFEGKLKKIAYRFASLRKIEMSVNATNITDYADENVIRTFAKFREKKGNLVYEFSEEEHYNRLDPLYNTQSILGPYIKMLKKITANEVDELNKIYLEAFDYYLNNKDNINLCEDLFKFAEVNWPAAGTIYNERTIFDYYLFNYTNTSLPPKNLKELKEAEYILENVPEPDEFEELTSYPVTKFDIGGLPYWLKYCAIATLVNVMLPIYWPTGINIAGVPIPLPIIYLPIIPLNIGPLIIVIGLGICGICPLPMILFANTGPTKKTVLIPIDLAIDFIEKLIAKIKAGQEPSIKAIINPLIKSLDNEINECIEEGENIEYQIAQVKNVSIDAQTELSLKEVLSKDTTTHVNNAELEQELMNPEIAVDVWYGPTASWDEVAQEMLENEKQIREKYNKENKEIYENAAKSWDEYVKRIEEEQRQLAQQEYEEESYGGVPIRSETTSGSYEHIQVVEKINADYTSTVHTSKISTQGGRIPKYLIIHYTAGGNSKPGMGRQTCYMWRDSDREASADFVVDDGGQYQYNPDPTRYYCFAVGAKKVDSRNGGGVMWKKAYNNNCISIEICSSLKKGYTAKDPDHAGWYFTDAVLAQARDLAKKLMKKYNISINNVYRHFDVTGKSCPGIIGWTERTDAAATEWKKFKKSLTY